MLFSQNYTLSIDSQDICHAHDQDVHKVIMKHFFGIRYVMIEAVFPSFRVQIRIEITYFAETGWGKCGLNVGMNTYTQNIRKRDSWPMGNMTSLFLFRNPF